MASAQATAAWLQAQLRPGCSLATCQALQPLLDVCIMVRPVSSTVLVVCSVARHVSSRFLVVCSMLGPAMNESACADLSIRISKLGVGSILEV